MSTSGEILCENNEIYIRTRRWHKENNTELSKQEEKPPKEDTSLYPYAKFYGDINYCITFESCAKAAEELFQEAENHEEFAIGFDMEWPFSFTTGPGKTALIQICADKRKCHLLYVYQFKTLPVELIAFLRLPNIKLCGVNIRNDVHKLARDFPGIPKEEILEKCIDSRTQAKQLACLQSYCMEKLVIHFLKMNIDKSDKVRKSKWHIAPLTEEQQVYAAVDAYISLVLYQHLSCLLNHKDSLKCEENPKENSFEL